LSRFRKNVNYEAYVLLVIDPETVNVATLQPPAGAGNVVSVFVPGLTDNEAEPGALTITIPEPPVEFEVPGCPEPPPPPPVFIVPFVPAVLVADAPAPPPPVPPLPATPPQGASAPPPPPPA
jgi:hypothetical protein